MALKELRSVDIKRAQLVPSSVFASPDEVLETGALSLPQKLAILRRWEFDARRVAAFGEASMLRRIQGAIQALSMRRQPPASFRPGPGVTLVSAAPPEPGAAPPKRAIKL